MPFRIGCLQMAFQALNQTFKQGKPLPDLYVLPVGLKYKYTQNMDSEIALTLQKLEQTLNLIPPSNLTPYQRLRLIAEQILNAIEQDYELSTPEIQTKILSGTERIERLRIKILEHCEQQLGFKTNPQDMVRERTYKLENFLKTQIEQWELNSVDFEFDLSTAQSANQSATSLQLMEKSLKRLLNFDAIYDGYVAENPSPERFLDTLIRLEREVFEIDQPPPKGFRQVFVKIGTPLNLKNIFLEYQHSPEAKGVNSTSRNEVIEQLTRKIQQEVQNNLDQINQEIYQLS